MHTLVTTARFPRFSKIVCLASALSVLGVAGCSSVAPSATAKGAGTGAVIGGLGGAAVGNNSSMGTGTGLAAGAALGAITGGIIGLVQDARDRREQDRLAQERAYNQDVAKRRLEESKAKLAMEEELAVAQGLRISEIEINDAKQKLDSRQAELNRLRGEWQAALDKKKTLDETLEKTIVTEAEIARMEEELARLKSDDALRSATGQPATAAAQPTSAPAGDASAAPAKPGI